MATTAMERAEMVGAGLFISTPRFAESEIQDVMKEMIRVDAYFTWEWAMRHGLPDDPVKNWYIAEERFDWYMGRVRAQAILAERSRRQASETTH